MVTKTLAILLILSTALCDLLVNRESRKNDYPDNSLWKKEYEEELTDAVLSTRKKDNNTRGFKDNEAVIEKLMEMIISSEKYSKKVNSIDFRLNRLDIEVHEKMNSILKQLTEISNAVKTEGYNEKQDSLVENLKNVVNQLKFMVEKGSRIEINGNQDAVEGQEYHVGTPLDTRLSFLENNVKSIGAGVESILTTISEVKNRQYTKTFAKPDTNAPSVVDTWSLINEFRRTLHEQKSRKCECKTGRFDRPERYPTDCHEIQMQGFNVSGIYKIKPEDIEPFYVLCDLNTVGGGWTVYQNRFDGSQDFYKGWSDYKHGFGNLAGEFWLGLEKLHYLTRQKLYELRIELETQNGQEAYAGYSVFTVGPEHEDYRISTLGTYYGTAGDSLSYHAGQKFSTLDMDNDEWKDGSCAIEHGGAWWYKECDKSNLNGQYTKKSDEQRGQFIYWISFKGPKSRLSQTKMMIRPLPASKPINIADKKNILEYSKHRGSHELPKSGRAKETKATFDVGRTPYRYEKLAHAEDFFPNFA